MAAGEGDPSSSGGAASDAPAGEVGAGVSPGAFDALFEDPAITQAMQSAHAHMRRLNERRKSEAQVDARAESTTAFGDQSDTQALNTAQAQFPHLFDQAEQEPLDLPPGIQLEGYLGRYAAKVDVGEEQSDAIVDSTDPLLAPTGSGELAPIDNELADQGPALEPENPLTALRIHEDLAEGITLPDIDTSVAPAGAAAAASVEAAGAVAFGANGYEDSDVVVTPRPGGAEISYQLRSAESPEEFVLDFDLPAGASLRADDGGGAVVETADETLAHVTAPAAIDADGWAVPVSASVDGHSLILRIDHQGGDWKYPLLLDPHIVENHYWIWGQDWTGWGSYIEGAGPWWNAQTDSGDWGRGMYTVGFKNNYYNAQENAGWFFHSPGPESFILRSHFAGVRNLTSDYCPYFGEAWSQTYLMTGMADIRAGGPWGGLGLWDTGGTSWEVVDGASYQGASPRIDACDKNYYREIGHCLAGGAACTYGGQHGNSMLFMTFMTGASTNDGQPLWGYAWEDFTSYLGGAEMYIGDNSPPVNSSPIHTTNGNPGLPSGWVNTANFSVVTRAQDNGLGIKQFKLIVPGYAEKLRTHACLGDRTDRCPISQVYRSDGSRVTGHSFTYRSASSSPTMPEGVNTIKASAKDLVGNWSANQTWQVKVDRSKPTIALSGPLWDRRGQTLAPGNYGLTAKASDQYSGASYLQVTVDGADIGTHDQACPSSGGCTRTVNATFDTSQWEPGQHTVKAVARDQVGHDADPVTFTVTVADEPAPSTMACTSASQAPNFQHYSLGPAFEGQLAGDPIRRCDSTYAGEPVRANYVSYLYGTCLPLSTPGAPQLAASCAPPVEIQSWPACERALADYELEPAVAYPAEGSTRRAVPVHTFDDGTRVEIYAEKTTIVIFGDDQAQVSRAVDAVQAEPSNAPPARPTPSLPGGDLPTPVAGAVEGTLSCVSGAPLLEAPEAGATAEAPETPSVPFSFGGPECTGARRYPVTALFTDGVEDEISAQTGWGTLSLGPDGGRTNALKIGADCVAQGADYASSGSTARYHMPLWSHPSPDGTVEPDGVTALATPYRETQRPCGWGVDSHKSSSPKEPSGFDKGRRQLSEAYRPNAVMTVYWGNSRSTVQCSDSPTTTVASASNGVVAFQSPLVPFGYNELWHVLYSSTLFPGRDPAGLALDGGSNSARIPVNWADVEPGEDDVINWGLFGRAHDELVARGIHPIIAIYDAPDWADHPPGGTACHPTNHLAAHRPHPDYIPNEWRELVAAATDRFSGAAAIEIWNEPNLRRFWSGCDAQPGRYAQLLRHGYEAVKGVDQDMPVITAGMAPDSTTNWKGFLRDVDDFLTGKFWDGLGLHPYRSQEHKANKVSIVNSAIRQFRAARHLGMGRKVWVTEVGVTTFGDWDNPVRVGSPGDAAYFLTEIYKRLRDRGAESVIIHRFRDRSHPPESGLAEEPDPQKGAGVLFSDFVCKPAFFELAAAREVTADCAP